MPTPAKRISSACPNAERILPDILFRSGDVEVRRVAAGDGRAQVITFESYHDDEGFDRPGFGESFFAHEQVAAVHVLCRTNDWYQYAEMPEAMAVARAAMAAAGRRLAYGSSMGGYAAIRFGQWAGADAVLALSPQYSVDPTKARFDRRWHQDQCRIRFRPDLDGPIATTAGIVCVYDPHEDADRQHVELIARDVPVTPLALPYGSHGIGAFLNEIELLRPLVLDVLAGDFDPASVIAGAEQRRDRSPTWLGERAGRLPAAAAEEAMALARRAAELAPTSAAVQHRLALRLRDLERYDEAVAHHHDAIALEDNPIYLWGLSKTLSMASRPHEALDAARRILEHMPRAAGHHRWAARLALEVGEEEAALTYLRRAVALFPSNWRYRYSAFLLGTRLALRQRWRG